jgi:hypothetical protein
VSEDPVSPELLEPIRDALGRVAALRDKGIPYDPVVEIATLREALSGEGGANAADVAATLASACDRIEVAWAELDMLRASVAYLSVTVRRRRGGSSPTLDVATEFLQTWNARFSDAPSLEARAQLAHRLESRLQAQLGVPPSASPAGRPVSVPSTSLGGASLPALAAAPPSAGVAAPALPGSTPTRAAPPTHKAPAPPAAPAVPSAFVAWLGTASGLTFLVVLAFVLVGAYDRLHALGALSLWNDEAQSTLVAFSIVQQGYPVISSQHLINNYEPLYPYAEALSIFVLGHSNLAYRVPAAVFGIVLIPVAYYVGSRLRDRYVGIALAAMTAFSSELIAWSRQARWYILLVLIMAVAFYLATEWARTDDRRRRMWLLLGLLALGVLAALTSVGLFLLYIPAILLGAVTYFVVLRWPDLRRFFGVRATPDEVLPPPGRLNYSMRRVLAVGIPLALLVAVIVERRWLATEVPSLAARFTGFTPYPLTWSGNFAAYLQQYYLGLLVLAALGGLVILVRREPLEMGLLAFCIASFLSVSTLASLTNDIAGGETSFERHLLPLIFFLFLVGAVGLVEAVRWVRGLLQRFAPELPSRPAWRPAAFGALVVVVLVLPGIVAPSGLTVHEHPSQFPTGTLVRWDPFSVDPAQPSAVFQTDQADYQYASEYVAAHRNATDIVAATNPGPPQVYLGPVQFWVRGNADPTTEIFVGGQPAFFQTGSLLVANTTQLEGILFNGSGWLISDVPLANGPSAPFPGGMYLVLTQVMETQPGGSGPSITLYSWNETSRTGLLRDAARQSATTRPLLSNVSALYDWAATTGVSTSGERPLLLPLESFLVRHASANATPLAVLLNYYNGNTTLQNTYPMVTEAKGSDTALIHWAYEVDIGKIVSPEAKAARGQLLPYESWYEANGG